MNITPEKIEKIFGTIKRSLSITSLELANIYGIDHDVFMMFVHPVIEQKIREYNLQNPENRVMFERVDYCPRCKSVYQPYIYTSCPKCGYEIVHIIHYFRGEENRKLKTEKRQLFVVRLPTFQKAPHPLGNPPQSPRGY